MQKLVIRCAWLGAPLLPRAILRVQICVNVHVLSILPKKVGEVLYQCLPLTIPRALDLSLGLLLWFLSVTQLIFFDASANQSQRSRTESLMLIFYDQVFHVTLTSTSGMYHVALQAA